MTNYHSIYMFADVSRRLSRIRGVRVVVNKIFRILLNVKQDDHNIPEIGIHELYRTLSVLRLYDVYNYNLLIFIIFAMNNRSKLFEEFFEPHLSLQNYHARNSLFNLPPVRLLKGTSLVFKV